MLTGVRQQLIQGFLLILIIVMAMYWLFEFGFLAALESENTDAIYAHLFAISAILIWFLFGITVGMRWVWRQINYQVVMRAILHSETLQWVGNADELMEAIALPEAEDE